MIDREYQRRIVNGQGGARDRERCVLERGPGDDYLSRREAYSACVAISKCYPLLSRKRFFVRLQALLCRVTRFGDMIVDQCDETQREGMNRPITPRAISYLKAREAATVLAALQSPYRVRARRDPYGEEDILRVSDIYAVLTAAEVRTRIYWRAVARRGERAKALKLIRRQRALLRGPSGL